MLIVPLLLTVVVSVAVFVRYEEQVEAFILALAPMWLCYMGVAMLDILDVM